jgi:hypothetical protein
VRWLEETKGVVRYEDDCVALSFCKVVCPSPLTLPTTRPCLECVWRGRALDCSCPIR